MNIPTPSLPQIVEALIFASPEPLTTSALVRAIRASAAALAAEKAAATEDEETPPLESDPLLDKPDTSESPVLDAPPDPEPPEAPAEYVAAGAEDELVQETTDETTGTEEAEEEASADEPVWTKVTESEVLAALAELVRTYDSDGRAYTLQERASGWRVFTRPEFAPWVRGLFPERKAQRLSQPALETLAIIAYRQPITKAAIEAVRGVSVDGPMQKLLDQNIVRIAGRADLPGRPLLYETTDLFFEHFGIRSIDDLPNAGELRRVALPQPDSEKPAEPTAEQPELPVADAPPPEEAPPAEK